MKRFVDTNVFVYAATGHPRFGENARGILERIEAGEAAVTSTLVLCEVSWVLEAMGAGFDEDDLLVGANNMAVYRIDFNDGVNAAIMGRLGVTEAYSNDERHLGKVDFLQLIFE
ncbi:MAG: type II toxin-antitoxin system VapC family toxin [Deltaproteobacteria bacterium]|nr:type II toxin-antitoxin system VapC family toxin [Deltaproteobacteria bacterium]